MQDSEGDMWYGTEGGLCRDNGYQIDLFRPEDTDRQREAYQVNAVVENGEGDIVFGTAYGLYIIHKQDYQVRSVSLDSEQHFIESLFVDSRQHLWVGCRGMFFECEGNGEVIERFPSLIAGKPAAVTGIAEGRVVAPDGTESDELPDGITMDQNTRLCNFVFNGKTSQQGNWQVTIRSVGSSNTFETTETVTLDFSAATGIEAVENEKMRDGDNSSTMYDLSGRRVNTTENGGIYVTKGKKVISNF